MDNRAGQMLRDRRLELGMTQEEVALELGMSLHQYQRYEYGDRRMMLASGVFSQFLSGVINQLLSEKIEPNGC